MSVTQVVESSSPEETRKLGLRLGAMLKAGDFVALSGQLGAGKTLFAKAIADALARWNRREGGTCASRRGARLGVE